MLFFWLPPLVVIERPAMRRVVSRAVKLPLASYRDTRCGVRALETRSQCPLP